jgi:outer membrane lipoprotein-sorting protein
MGKAGRILGWAWVVLAGLMPPAAPAQEPGPDVRAILDRMDKLYRAETSYAQVQMTVVTPDWQRTLDLEVWSEGLEQTFILINSPLKDKGTTTLRVKTEMWNYFPKIDKVMRVPPSMMMGAWMGSDFTNDDLVKESTFINGYTGELIHPADAKPEYYYLELKPKAATVTVWAKIVAVVQKDTYLPLTETYYDEKGTAMRVIEFKEVKDLGGRRIPAVMELTPLGKPGHKTTITYLQARFNQPLPPDTFTLQNLQKKR